MITRLHDQPYMYKHLYHDWLRVHNSTCVCIPVYYIANYNLVCDVVYTCVSYKVSSACTNIPFIIIRLISHISQGKPPKCKKSAYNQPIRDSCLLLIPGAYDAPWLATLAPSARRFSHSVLSTRDDTSLDAECQWTGRSVSWLYVEADISPSVARGNTACLTVIPLLVTDDTHQVSKGNVPDR